MTNNKTIDNNIEQDIALKLIFNKPIDSYLPGEQPFVEKIFTEAQLYGNGNHNLTCEVLGEKVEITYVDGLLVIKTPAEATILLSGNTPALGIHVETNGGFGVTGAKKLKLKIGMYAKADKIVIDAPVTCNGFLTLIANNNEDSLINVSCPVATDKLNLQTKTLDINSGVKANTALVDCGLLQHNTTKQLLIKSGAFAVSKAKKLLSNTCIVWRKNIQEHMCQTGTSEISAKDMQFSGTVNISGAELNAENTIQFLPGSKSNFSEVTINSDKVQIDKNADIEGKAVTFKVTDKFDVDGKCIVDGLNINTVDANVTGLVWGDSSLNMRIKEFANFNGVIGSKETDIKAKYLLGTAILGNQGLCYKSFVNGGIIGTSNLKIDTLASLRACGAYLYGPNIYTKSGIDVDLLSYSRSYNYIKDSLYEYGLTIKMPCSPKNMKDLLNTNKQMRVAEMIGSNFPILRGLVATKNIADTLGSFVKEPIVAAIKSIWNDPNPRHQINNLIDVGASATKSMSESVQQSMSDVVDLAMSEWNTDTVKHFVDGLLKARGAYMQGNMLLSQATQTLIFINDLENHTIYNPDFTMENGKNLVGDVLQSAQDLASNKDDVATKLVNNAVEYVGKDAEDFKNTITDSDKLLKLAKEAVDIKTKDEKGEDITLTEAAKGVLRDHISSITNAPTTLYNNITGAYDAISSINVNDSYEKVLTDPINKVNAFMAVGKAAYKGTESEHPIQAAALDSKLFWGVAKETAHILSPCVYSTSFVSHDAGLTLTGNYIVNTGFYKNSGMSVTFGTSIHSFYDIYNSGAMFSHRHSETARDRYNNGAVFSRESNIFARDNFENGITNASEKLIFDVRNNNIAANASFKSTGQTSGHIRGDLVSHGDSSLKDGNLKIDGKSEFTESATTDFDGIKLQMNGGLKQSGTLELNRCIAKIDGGTELSESSTTKSLYSAVELNDGFEDNGNLNIEHSVLKGNASAKFSETSETYVKSSAISFKNIERANGSQMQYENVFLSEAETMYSGPTSSLQGGKGSLFVARADKADHEGIEHHYETEQTYNQMPTDESRDLSLGIGKHKNKTAEVSFDVATDRSEVTSYAGSTRADGAQHSLRTGGIYTLPPEYSRAQGMTFNSYAEMESFVSGYSTWNLPPPPPPKLSSWQKFKREAKRVGGQVLAPASVIAPAALPLGIGAVIGTLCAGGAYAIDKSLEHDQKKENNRQREADLLQAGRNLNIQNNMLEYGEYTALNGISKCQQRSARINNMFDEVYSVLDPNYINTHILSEQFDNMREDSRKLFMSERTALQSQYSKIEQDIKYAYAQQERMIKLRHATQTFGAGVSVNTGTTGVSTNMTYQISNNGQTVNAHVPIHNHDFPRLQKNKATNETVNAEIKSNKEVFAAKSNTESQTPDIKHHRPDESYMFGDIKNKQSYEKAEAKFLRLNERYQKESDKYHTEVAKLNAEKSIFARTAADLAKGDLEESLGAKVFKMANRLQRLREEMNSYIIQDLEQKRDKIRDKLAREQVAEQKHARHISGQPSIIKDYSQNAGLLFGYAARHVSTSLNGMVNRHTHEVKVTALAGFIAAPMATAVGAGVYSVLSSDPVQSRVVKSFSRTLDALGIDSYNRDDLARFATEGFKIGMSGIAPKAGPTLIRQGIKGGERALAGAADKDVLLFKFRDDQQKSVLITGGRSIGDEIARQDLLASELYSNIRASIDDVQKIARNLDMPEFQVRRIKEHIFNNTHQLDHGKGIARFDPDLKIAEAWKRLESGMHTESDFLILRHEYFESRFEGIFKTDYRTAHNAANRAGRPSGLEDLNTQGVRNGFIYRD